MFVFRNQKRWMINKDDVFVWAFEGLVQEEEEVLDLVARAMEIMSGDLGIYMFSSFREKYWWSRLV